MSVVKLNRKIILIVIVMKVGLPLALTTRSTATRSTTHSTATRSAAHSTATRSAALQSDAISRAQSLAFFLHELVHHPFLLPHDFSAAVFRRKRDSNIAVCVFSA